MTTKSTNLVKMAAKAEWNEGIQSTNTIRNFETFTMDEPVNLGGKDAGATPLEYVSAALNGCKAVMIPLIAKELNFSFSGISFETAGYVDFRGIMGEEGIRTYFQNVDFTVEIETTESDDTLEKLKAEVERRCPVYNLFVEAGITVNTKWIRK